MHRSTIALSMAMLALAGCQADAPAEEGSDDEQGGEAASTSTKDAVSILRPDVVPPTPAAQVLQPLNVRISFEEDGKDISPAGLAVLKGVLASDQMQEGGAIILRGHSDAAGSDRVNMDISRDRAEAVRDWLVDAGVEAGRISVIAFGEQNPIEPNALPDGTANEAGRAANRRVDLTVLTPPPKSEAEPDSVSGSAS